MANTGETIMLRPQTLAKYKFIHPLNELSPLEKESVKKALTEFENFLNEISKKLNESPTNNC